MNKKSFGIMAGLMACFLIFLTGCTPTYVEKGADNATAITVSVKIVAEDANKTLYNGNISVKSTAPTLAMATYQALITAKVSYSEVGGEYNNFAGYPTTIDKGWVCTVNGVRVETGEKQQAIQNGDKIEWSYVELS